MSPRLVGLSSAQFEHDVNDILAHLTSLFNFTFGRCIHVVVCSVSALIFMAYGIPVHGYSTLFIFPLFGCLDCFQYGAVINGAGVSIPPHLLVPRCRCCVEYALRVRLTDFQVGAHLASVNDGACIPHESPDSAPPHCQGIACIVSGRCSGSCILLQF